ncbi:hypothetical protein [Candidatus Regiella endosymbiont of Tuberolachnus salignus]|uniref:hypothetical protein n=1 Tax=Candidatus Regiella endosymbiont of Tuberolachnus salignus TaxID=3077956 RepID=UPI0030D0479C
MTNVQASPITLAAKIFFYGVDTIKGACSTAYSAAYELITCLMRVSSSELEIAHQNVSAPDQKRTQDKTSEITNSLKSVSVDEPFQVTGKTETKDTITSNITAHVNNKESVIVEKSNPDERDFKTLLNSIPAPISEIEKRIAECQEIEKLDEMDNALLNKYLYAPLGNTGMRLHLTIWRESIERKKQHLQSQAADKEATQSITINVIAAFLGLPPDCSTKEMIEGFGEGIDKLLAIHKVLDGSNKDRNDIPTFIVIIEKKIEELKLKLEQEEFVLLKNLI